MPLDPAQAETLKIFLVRSVEEGVRTREQLKADSLEMFARQLEGVDVVEVTVESALTRAQLTTHPATMHAALEAAIAETDPANPLRGVDTSTRYTDLSAGRIET